MYKWTCTYEDFDENERTEEFRFNLTKSEISEMELGTSGGYADMLRKIVASQDRDRIIAIFKQFVLKAYGEKSLDGKRFVKSDEISKAFSETGAYDQLFIQLISDAKFAAEFVTSTFPKDMQKALKDS